MEHFIMTLMAVIAYDTLKKAVKHFPTNWYYVRFNLKYNDWLPNPKSPAYTPVGHRVVRHLMYARIGSVHIRFWTTKSPWIKEDCYGDKEFKEALGAYGEAGR